ncbi:MAG: hypothetical protein Q8910_02800 [Bacteroidota bacterium]|nr:hypothetical protein [Bacteroidota bacterium]
MNSQDYLNLELQQLFNENETPYVSERSRANAFLKNSSISGGCPMCCGGAMGSHYGGCADCPYCHGMGGGVTGDLKLRERPILDREFVSTMPYQTYIRLLKERYGITFQHFGNLSKRVAQKHRERSRAAEWVRFNSLTLDEKMADLAKKEAKFLVPPSHIEQLYEERVPEVRFQPEEIRKNPPISQAMFEIVKNKFTDETLWARALEAKQLYDDGEISAMQLSHIVTDLLEQQNKNVIKTLTFLEPSESVALIPYVKEVIEEIKEAAPIKKIKESTTKKELEGIRVTAVDTWRQCMARQTIPGQKRKKCIHLTKKYLEGKLDQIDVKMLFNNYADCLKATKKGLKRTRCAPLAKSYTMKKGVKREKTILRHKKILAKAKRLKVKHPDMTYADRIKEARKLVPRGGDLSDMVLDNFQTISNLYRESECDGRSRPLYRGEIHAPCHNYTGPGTVLNDRTRNFPPYDEIDNCSRNHDLEYESIFDMPQGNARESAIRKSDQRAIDCYNRNKNEPSYKWGYQGIKNKMMFEDNAPRLARLMAKEYYGHE